MPENTMCHKRPIAVCPVCNHGGYEILAIEERAEGYFVEIALNDGEKQTMIGFRRVNYRVYGSPYIKLFGDKIPIDSFMKI